MNYREPMRGSERENVGAHVAEGWAGYDYMYKEYELTDREYFVLIIIDALRICTAEVVAWLAGYTDYSYCRKSLMRLYNNGYVSIVKGNNGKNCYFLKSKGLKSIGKYNSRVYEVSSMTNHCLEVGIVCAWLRATRKLHFSDMMLDMQLRESQSVGEHRPDIVVGNLAFEIELNHKRKETLTRNVLSNELTYDGQVWLVPQRKANIRRSLAEIFADNVIADDSAKILCLEDIHQEICLCNIHNNTWQAPPLP